MKTIINGIKFQNTNLKFKSFLIGIFFLPSAPAISLLLFLIPIILGLKENFKKFIKDRQNLILLLVTFLMLFKSIITSFADINNFQNWDASLNWAGLGNWIPQFLIYLGAQIYVQDASQREKVAKSLILGTVPVIFSCFSQYFFKWHGPYQLFNGLIIWYQRPRTELEGITGLFNNPNYSGAWLAMIWPFLITYLIQKRKDGYKFQFLIIFCFSILVIISISLINSRGAWLGIISSLPLIFGENIFIWLSPLILLIIFSILSFTLIILPETVKQIFSLMYQGNIPAILNDLNINFENIPRLNIWNESINLILEKPLFGWGAAIFPIIYFSKYGEWQGHPHNLFLELSISDGLITSILIFTFIGLMVFSSTKKIFHKKNDQKGFERAWWASVIIFLILHIFDVLYFDLRISIVFWILLAGLKGLSNKEANLEFNKVP